MNASFLSQGKLNDHARKKKFKNGWRQSTAPSLPSRKKTFSSHQSRYQTFLLLFDFAWFLQPASYFPFVIAEGNKTSLSNSLRQPIPNSSGIFRSLSNIYEGAFYRKKLTTKKSTTINSWNGSQYVIEFSWVVPNSDTLGHQEVHL